MGVPEETVAASQMPEPPRRPGQGAERHGRAPRRGGLTEEAIVTAAMAIVDSEGLDALTMRAVAARLRTGAASLYAHVRSKDDLIDLLLDRVIAEMHGVAAGEAPDPARWREQITAVAVGMREVWGRHGDLARASFARVPLGENSMTGAEAMIAKLRAGGLSDQVVALASDLISLYVGATAYEDSLEGGMGMDPVEWETYGEQLRRYFAALPAERFPNMVALAGALTTPDVDRFEFGLDVILAGLVAYDAAHPEGHAGSSSP